MIRAIKLKIYKFTLWATSKALSDSDGVELEEVNWMVSQRNWALREIKKMESE